MARVKEPNGGRCHICGQALPTIQDVREHLIEYHSDRVAVVELCGVCEEEIQVAIFKGTGVCCENHRKIRDGELLDK